MRCIGSRRCVARSVLTARAQTPSGDEVVEVILNEGDVFYFPSGMYHRVECVEDSVSINLSLEPCKFAEYLR